MAKLSDSSNPSFALWPVNNNRTAWRPVSLPMVLIEPNRYDRRGVPIPNSEVLQVRVVIEDVPHHSLVSGHDHIGMLYPDHEIYARSIYPGEIIQRRIECRLQKFFRADGTEITFNEATDGDLMQYTTISGVRDTVQYLLFAEYYDLSDIVTETEDLPSGRYYLAYQVDYYVRMLSTVVPGHVNCIDTSRIATAVYRFELNHPGELLDETVRLTPTNNLTSAKRSEDTTIEFYRPFTDVLQDVFDEQTLLRGVNWPDKVPPEYLPYLAYLLGLEIPYFPRSLDNLRRTMLRNLVRLQQLKGSRRALIELFELFGFTINIVSLYWSADGKRLIRPGERLPKQYADQFIEVVQKLQIEPLLSGYNTDGYGQLQVPLLYRPTLESIVDGVATELTTAPVLLDAYLVEAGSAAESALLTVCADLDTSPGDYGEIHKSLPIIPDAGVVGYSQIHIDQQTTTLVSAAGEQPPFIAAGVNFDRRQNIINLTFNGSISFSQKYSSTKTADLVLYAFATYAHADVVLPATVKDLRSNRFDVQLLTRDGSQPSPDIIEFLIDFLFKLKAFHSLLNVVVYSCRFDEVYQVTDFSVGGDFQQRYDTDIGQLQVPPAIAPKIPQSGDCNFDPDGLGYKPEDIAYRAKIMDGLPEENIAWLGVTGAPTVGSELIVANSPISPCDASKLGQYCSSDTGAFTVSDIDETNPRPPDNAETLTGSDVRRVTNVAVPTANADTSAIVRGITETDRLSGDECPPPVLVDYKYRGRVKDDINVSLDVALPEHYAANIAQLQFGSGGYYTLPAAIPNDHASWHGRQSAAIGTDGLCYAAGCQVTGNDLRRPAFYKPELNIQQPYLHFPGCRFPTANALTSDFVSVTWNARPWDGVDLNARLVAEPTTPPVCGIQANALEFDVAPYTLFKNGLTPDITGFVRHSGTPSSIVHAIYSHVDAGHPAIQFDDSLVQDVTIGETINVATAIFSTATTVDGVIEDFIDGYAASTGFVNATYSDRRSALYAELFGLTTDIDREALFFFGDGIYCTTGYRFDGGCEYLDVVRTTSAAPRLGCNLDQFRDDDGELDLNIDSVAYDLNMVLPESIGCNMILFDGSIPTMLELLPN